MKPFTLFCKKGKALSKDAALCFDTDSILHCHDTIQDYLDNEGFNYNPKEIKKATLDLELDVLSRLRDLSFIQYRKFELSKDWGEAGDYQCFLSFSRHLTGKKAQEDLSSDTHEAFHILLQEGYEGLDLKALSLETVSWAIDNFVFNFFGRKIKLKDVKRLNLFLKFLGSDLFVSLTTSKKNIFFIASRPKQYKIGDHTVYWMKEELVRSSNIIIAEAAFSGDREVCIRQEALETIFYQKWVASFDSLGKNWSAEGAASHVSDGIKLHVLRLYSIKTKEDLINVKKEFIKNMGETIVYHELGHIVIQQDILPWSLGALAEAHTRFGYESILSIIEVLADFAPQYRKLHGALKQIEVVALKDPDKASKMFYTYLSDIWFYDTSDRYMYLYSDYAVLSLLKYIKEDRSIDFEKINKDLSFDKRRKEENKRKDVYINTLFSLVLGYTKKAKALLESSMYTVGSTSVDFKGLKAYMDVKFLIAGTEIREPNYNQIVMFWSNVLLISKEYGSKHKELELLMETHRKQSVKKLLHFIAGKDKARHYNDDARAYIYDFCKSVGLSSHVT